MAKSKKKPERQPGPRRGGSWTLQPDGTLIPNKSSAPEKPKPAKPVEPVKPDTEDTKEE